MFPISPKHLLYTVVGNKRPPRRGVKFSEEDTLEVQRIFAAHAYRFIYSHDCDSNISNLRPRIVDLDTYNQHNQFWTKWHYTNQAIELDLLQK